MPSDSIEIPGIAPPLPVSVFHSRRERLLSSIGAGVVLLRSAPELLRSRDTEVLYRQDSDLFYLTGFLEPESAAVLTPHDPEHRFTLFVRPRDPDREAWSGPRIGVEAARERFGADAVYPIGELAARLPELVRPADRIHYALGAAAELDRQVIGLVSGARRSRPRTGLGPVGLEDLDARVGAMRMVKDEHEVERIRTAAAIAAAGHRAAMSAARAGVGEWEIQAAAEGTFRALGATGPSFPTIVGSGINGTVLHHVANDRRVGPDELVLVDAGAEWGMYCSDITRTFPVSGRFTRSQRALYEVVLASEEAAIAAARPGAPFTGVHDAAVAALVEGMVRLGLLEGEPEQLIQEGAHRRFYLHQTSHWLGLDVHDAGPYRVAGAPVALEPGMVLTVEPGLYVPAAADVPAEYRGIGIRIEDDVLITSGGREVLTRAVPVDPDEVEALVGG